MLCEQKEKVRSAMSWNSFTIDRDDIDGFEKITFKGLNVTTGNQVLGLDEDDNLILNKAKSELEKDIVDALNVFINDGSFTSEASLLDEVVSSNNGSMLENLLCYKFLEIWFRQNAAHKDSKAYLSAVMYYRKYANDLPINMRRISSKFTKPRRAPRLKFQTIYE